jgi:hypothetical protein
MLTRIEKHNYWFHDLENEKLSKLMNWVIHSFMDSFHLVFLSFPHQVSLPQSAVLDAPFYYAAEYV